MTIRPSIGTGVVAATGSGVEGLFEDLCRGVTGRAGLRGFERTGFRPQQAYEVDGRPRGRRRPTRPCHQPAEAGFPAAPGADGYGCAAAAPGAER
ncbi:hypothetical protein ACFWWM_33770 [Streptomyces sp. NPDC058682]|uniref:hypothetical protein n=1 Tax=unclassified Streptomyces TaxID=2593676 RepID=UPI002253A02B|nr:hypothetical protein [Streptomyces sp. NBC_01214]MCX4803099.1 hypothetical protein [Streptomyces sp. NBC_01214]